MKLTSNIHSCESALLKMFSRSEAKGQGSKVKVMTRWVNP